MAGVDVGSAYVTIIPSAQGFGSTLQRELGGGVAQAGTAAGDTAGRGSSPGSVARSRGSPHRSPAPSPVSR